MLQNGQISCRKDCIPDHELPCRHPHTQNGECCRTCPDGTDDSVKGGKENKSDEKKTRKSRKEGKGRKNKKKKKSKEGKKRRKKKGDKKRHRKCDSEEVAKSKCKNKQQNTV